jgi:predicted SAM-dependent methyltransferase
MKYLNLGCGVRFHTGAEWINADMAPADDRVVECNFLNGIPYPDNEFDLVYHSHVLEHFKKDDGRLFIKECYRILKPGAVIRIALPDLEKIAKEYIKNLQGVTNGQDNLEADYDWILLEMYDQTIRERTGGKMGDYLRSKIPNVAYVSRRIGDPTKNNSHVGTTDIKANLQRKQKTDGLAKRIKRKLSSMLMSLQDKQALAIGRFRMSGEIHQWMYDRYSLSRLLRESGFREIVQRTATDSYIPGWSAYQLDNAGEEASLYMEAVK